ncbi:MAG TPA: recombinase family protein, partial [Candidatus Saccharimonadales bacterium]|nr:recombinase family protein [Candidatus Saccharimonadales bacterium]
AWYLMATGTKSLREMAAILNDQGLHDQQKGRKEMPLRPQTLSNIFRNKFYAGKLISKKYGMEVQGQHAPMVTEEMFYRVQAILDGRNRNAAPALARRNQDSEDFPLRRIVKCARCQHSFTAAWSKGKKNRYGYYFCPKRCAAGSSIPVKQVEDTTADLLARISLRPETVKLINAFLRQAYYLRIGALRKKREQADVELQKLQELRQKLIEKNLNGVYSDEIFKEQNKLLEDKIKSIQTAKSDTIIEKYNLEAITDFIQQKFTDLNNTFAASLLKQKRVLMCSIFPQGLSWGYPGYSNTQISPFYRCLMEVEENNVLSGTLSG